MKNSKKEPKVIASVLKALDVMELISKYEDGLTVTEISNVLGYGTSATYHLLNTLRLRNYLTQNPVSKKYKLGIKPYLLFAANPWQNLVTEIAKKHMEKLTESFDENCNLLFLIGNEVEYIAQTECKRMLRMFTQIGAKVPFYCTGGGKAIFAFLPKPKQEKILRNTKFIKFTTTTIDSAESLLSDAEDIKKCGVAFDREEREQGVYCVAAPIFADSENPIAAISMSCPITRLDNEKQQAIINALKKSAEKISQELMSGNVEV